MGELREAMQREMALRGFAPRTHKVYVGWMRRLVRHARVPAELLSEAQVRDYLARQTQRGLSASTMNQAISAVRFFYHEVLHRDWELEIHYQRAPQRVPVTLSREEEEARKIIEQAFAKAGLTVPAVKDVLAKTAVEAKRAQKIVNILVREGVLVKVTEDLLFHRAALERLAELLRSYKKQKGERIAVPAFKELTGVTRKYAIPLLEYLDRQKLTRRVGDERLILL